MNILYIHTHDSGKILSPYGYKVPTPNLEAFAKDAVQFENCFCASPTCSPSRASLLTGQLPHSNGMTGLAHRGFHLAHPDRHLNQLLQRNGWRTALCGVQHEAATDEELGYQEILTVPHSGGAPQDNMDWDHANAREAAAWLRKQSAADTPFFLSCGFSATHRPYPVQFPKTIDPDHLRNPHSPDNHRADRLDFAGYCTLAASFDEGFGLVIQALKDSGLYDQTIIFSTTDHGNASPFAKCTLSDMGIGVSLFMRVPHAVCQGQVEEGLVSHLDIVPTLCDLVSIDRPQWLQGQSIAGLFTDGTPPQRDMVAAEINVHTSYEPTRCIRTRRYKYIRYFDEQVRHINYSNWDDSPTKQFYMEHGLKEYRKPLTALYDLYYDPQEKHNVIDDPRCQSVRDAMAAQLWQLMIQTQDPLAENKPVYPADCVLNKPECEVPDSDNPDDYLQLPFAMRKSD